MRLVIAGGGAAGFFAAIAAAEANREVEVLLLERTPQPLAKVRVSGGGRCNVTHACFDPATLTQHYPRGAKALLGPFTRFQPRDTVQWFAQRGVQLKTEADGRMFPVTDDSATIVNCLLGSAERAGVRLHTSAVIDRIERESGGFSPPGGFSLRLNSGAVLSADRVALATGGARAGYDWARGLGHAIIDPVPSLFTFKVSDPRLEDLAGLSVANGRVWLPASGLEQTGPVLITHWGLSGPAVLKLSAWGARALSASQYRCELRLSWLADWRADAVAEHLHERKRAAGAQRVSAHSPFGELPLRLWQRLVHTAEIFPEQQWAKLPKANLLKLAGELTNASYSISGKGQFKEEFVTAGGVALDEVNFKTMESKICPGLYFAGEILDIDGVTGGFNFQNAWTTGWLAGQAMAA